MRIALIIPFIFLFESGCKDNNVDTTNTATFSKGTYSGVYYLAVGGTIDTGLVRIIFEDTLYYINPIKSQIILPGGGEYVLKTGTILLIDKAVYPTFHSPVIPIQGEFAYTNNNDKLLLTQRVDTLYPRIWTFDLTKSQ